ncbi:hypothetical protein HN747_00280 [archaeon]|nr:hypothetical protein [archaeon]
MRIGKLAASSLVGLALAGTAMAGTNESATAKDMSRFTRPNVVMYSNNGKTTISNTNYTLLLTNYLKSDKEPDFGKTKMLMHGYMSLHKRNGFEYKGDGTWVFAGVVGDLGSDYWALEDEYNKKFEEMNIL